ncbi:hypothetical protein GCM10027598_54170 [Amycolatopsis oliviviridis]|uniref:Uncharacterized protein n=1 Tax=Amycolatopsis oliviviridis TaxID=1471590 RepID=A0ABQ3M9Z0_9PSEU|nr:hypothetical protein [Amycolatopsis oliviviridis]GHH35393.1 hypothetical protein GCM10017790_76710 [Amycolatopsis oliviviridis]
MTVHARRYGRWCREHFETEQEPDRKQPAEATDAQDVTDARAEQAQAGDVPEGKPGSLS